MSPYQLDEWAILSPEGLKAIKEKHTAQGTPLEPVPVSEEYPTYLSADHLGTDTVLTPTPCLVGRATAFQYFDEPDFKEQQ